MFLSGCGAIKESQVAKVHQAWNARYQYDLENRRMVSKYENKKIGRVKGRDEWGRVNYDRYWVMRPFKGENLLDFHNAKLDSYREDRWNSANRDLIEARKEKMAELATADEEGANSDKAENVGETSDEEFLPVPFLPQGIDDAQFENETPEINNNLPPFDSDNAPMPLEPAPEAPSPFAPLPPL